MKKIIGAIAGLALVLVTAGAAHAATPVIPNAPIVNAAYGACIGGQFVIDEADVTLPYVENGRWLDGSGQPQPTITYNDLAPGEYTFVFTTAEGDFTIPASPGGADDYRLESGTAVYTLTLPAVEAQDCGPVAPAAPYLSTAPKAICTSAGYLSYVSGWITLPSDPRGTWWQGTKRVSSKVAVPGSITVPTTYTFTFKIDSGGSFSFAVTVDPPVRPVCTR